MVVKTVFFINFIFNRLLAKSMVENYIKQHQRDLNIILSKIKLNLDGLMELTIMIYFTGYI
jgi:hypothetical protein